MFFEQKQLQNDLKIFLALVFTLIAVGFLFIYSASSVYALEKFGSSSYFLKKQFFGLLLGICALAAARFVPLDFIKRYSPLLFCGAWVLTACTLLPLLSERIHGSRRWLFFHGFSFQPSELLKISLLIYLAYFLTKKESKLRSLRYGYLPFVSILGLIAIILLKQPDFGITVTLITTAFLLFFIVQCKTKHLLLTIASAIPLIGVLVYMKPYRWQRIMTFLNPWNDPQGAGFQIIQSLIAIGSGNVTGIGISHSKQKFFYLPMQHTDFIFSIIAEETGFLGATLLISLYMLFLYFGIRIAWKLKDPFASLATLGFVLLITLQTIINLAVTTGLAPTKGIGLPFVSYGLSSLLCCLIMVGVIMNCVAENR